MGVHREENKGGVGQGTVSGVPAPNGAVQIYVGQTGVMQFGNTGIMGIGGPVCQGYYSLTTTGATSTLSAAQAAQPVVKMNGTLSSAASIVFPAPSLGCAVYLVDVSGIILGAFSITFACGTAKTSALSSITSTSDICTLLTYLNGIAISN